MQQPPRISGFRPIVASGLKREFATFPLEEADVKRFRLIVPAIAALALTISADALAKAPPAEWDGLVRIASKQLDYVYLQPGADFRGYTQVMLVPTEVAFHKNWKKDYNRTHRS